MKTNLLQIAFTILTSCLIGCSTTTNLENASRNSLIIRKVDLSNQRLTEFPIEITKMVNLEELILFNNEIEKLPPEIANLRNLRKLYISKNNLKYLPPEIGMLTKLEILYINHNKLEMLPPEIGKLQRLRELDLQYNNLHSLPEEIGNLQSLEYLCLYNNNLTSITSEIGNLNQLGYLLIGKNHIEKDLPKEIGKLTNLLELDVAHSGPMLRIPESISNIFGLEYIYVDQTTIVPYSINAINPRLKVVVKSY